LIDDEVKSEGRGRGQQGKLYIRWTYATFYFLVWIVGAHLQLFLLTVALLSN